MSKVTTLIVIFACLTTAFALTSILTKSYFFVNINNQLSYKLFHTTNGIIAYNVEYQYSLNGPIAQYILLDPVQNYSTPILQDVLTACGQDGGVFDRLQYHVQTSTLAYFCPANNSLLILNEKTYSVQNSIATGISGSFAEAKLTSDGSSLYVLLMGAIYLADQVPSQLVQFDLSSRTVVRSVVFDHGLQTDEYVNDFVSQNNETYALTNMVDHSRMTSLTTISIYSVALSGNTYELLQLTNFTNEGYSAFLSRLYQLGDYLVTNNMKDLIFLDKQGNTVSTYSNIGAKYCLFQKTVSSVPAMVTQEGSPDLYVLLYNETLLKFTALSDSITNEPIGTAFDFQVAYGIPSGNHNTSNLLFTIDVDQSNFIITNLQNSQVIYSMPNYYSDLMMTNSTFGVLKFGLLQVFNRQTNAPIGNVSIPTPFYLHKDTDTLYYSQSSNGVSCVIKRLDLTTLNTVDVQKYSDYGLCSDAISQFNVSDAGIPEFVALSQLDNRFTIVTLTHGIVHFDLAEYSNDVEYIVADFAAMSLYRLQFNSSSNSTGIYYYEYNGTGFDLKNSYNLDGPAVSSFYANESGKAFAFSDGSFKTIDLEAGSTTEYSFPTDTLYVSSFQDSEGKKHMIFSDARTDYAWTDRVTQPSLFDSNGVSQLPGTSNFTVQAGAAGPCAYWVVDGFITSVGLVKFYDACNQDYQQDTSIFSILQ